MFGIDAALLVAVAGFVATIVIGAPMTRALAEPDELRARGRRPRSPHRERQVVTMGFTPLDLGEDPMRWPSERPWPPGVQQPPWPSQTWDDEHFGSFWRGANPPPAEPEASPQAPTAEVPPPRKRTSPKRAPERLRARSKDTRERASAPAPSPRTPDRPAHLPAVKPPPLEELEQLISSIGLAGTVQTIMQRTGWDFRKAAHYLARMRQER